MSSFADDLPEGWRVWNEEPEGRIIVVYRPDVFDTQAFPAPCLPTIHMSERSPDQRPDVVTGDWYVTVTLEPEVRLREVEGRYETREDAIEGAIEAAESFASGEVDYRDAYQVPREEYLDELDRLIA